MLAHNRTFVEHREFEHYATGKHPDKKLVIASCMDTRLAALLLAAPKPKNGDARIIEAASVEVAHPFDSVMRSLLIATCELGVDDATIVAHTSCGAQHMSGKKTVATWRASAFRPSASSSRGTAASASTNGQPASATPRKPCVRAATGGEPPRHAAPRACDRFIMDSDTDELTQVEC